MLTTSTWPRPPRYALTLAVLLALTAGCDPAPDLAEPLNLPTDAADVVTGGEIAQAEVEAAPPIRIDEHETALPWAFASFGRWDRRTVTWRVDSAPPPLPLDGLRAAVREATAEWSAASGLALVEVPPDTAADIVISAESGGHHGDECPFDSTTLAHAFFPGSADPVCPRGRIHVNRSQRFTLSPSSSRSAPYDLHAILLHELGHALGLGHSTDPEAVMWSTYAGSRRKLGADDAAGMSALYATDAPPGGESPSGPTLDPPEWEPPRCVRDEDPAELCFQSTGLVGRKARVTILEWDKERATPVGWIDVVIAPGDVAPDGVATTCVEWTARWEHDGAGAPEFIARVVVSGVPPAVAVPAEASLLRVGKATVPCDG